jgi:RNA:NAD 2'-phosphotransferase (TPT1/KptA family)
MPEIIWTSYLRYRATRRGFDLDLIENILRFSSERYYDVETDRAIAVGKHSGQLVLISYEQSENTIIPITIHATTRQQIRFRLKTGRLITNV